MNIRILSKICLLFFIFIVVNYIYIWVTTTPAEGDSIGYHIPIAKAYLNGAIFNPEKIAGSPFLSYSPGASEGILSLFYLFHIPANLFNVLGVILLFFACFYLGIRYKLGTDFSIIFASSIATLNGVVRWLDTQIIDIYLAVFFVLSLALLQKPEKKVSYFLKLGIVMGMLMGSKYSGLLFVVVLFLVYGKNLYKYLSERGVIVFAIPFTIFGLFWYLRNLVYTDNPLYPQGFLFFKDHGFKILDFQVWKVMNGSLYGLLGTINAFISEYMIWGLSVPIVCYYIYKRVSILFPFIIVGVLNILIYLNLPSDNKDYIMTSVMRYSYPAFIPFILGLFLLAQRYVKEEALGVIAIVNMMFVGFPLVYNPKLVFVVAPIALAIFWSDSASTIRGYINRK
jgi:hypothetical protein